MNDTEMTVLRDPDTVAETPSPSTAHVIPHTHWDREWYRSFQVFRARLVRVVDRVLEILQSDTEFRSFTLDGQAIVLEDYLEVRPERREEIADLVRSGRLHIGPWYVLADEFLVSPEALVRNLMLGIRTSREFGEPMRVAYTPDSFGHISQLPLIARGFGLEDLVFERGVGDEGEEIGSEFRWIAADGSTDVFAVHLVGTYSAAAALGHADWEMEDAYRPDVAIAHVRALLHGTSEDLAGLPDWFRASIERISGGLAAYSDRGAFILLSGSDHLFPQAELPQILRDLNEAFDDVTFVHSDVETFMADVKASGGGTPEFCGEFRGSRYQHILSGVLSARMYLKQANHHAELLLERYAEPLATLAWSNGSEYPSALLRQAWRLLLRNHPHDSICGCSIDAVHREMMTRFEGVEQLGEDIAGRALRFAAGADGRDALAVFNPSAHPRTEVVEYVVDVPANQRGTLAVFAGDGREVASHAIVEEVPVPGRSDASLHRITLRFLAELPPLGIAGFSLAPSDAQPPPTDVSAGDGFLENGALRVDHRADGSLVLLDKANDVTYPLHLHLEDVGDAGDEYDYSPVPGDEPLRIALADRPAVVTTAGTVSATMRFEGEARLPAKLSRDRTERVGEVTLPFVLEATLDAASPLLRLRIELTNHARDHRLRLRVATTRHSENVWADGHFDVLHRPVRPPDGTGWFQAPGATNHQRHFVAVQDDRCGLAVLNRGLPEYEAIPTEEGVDLALTLLRSVGWLSREDLVSRPQGAGPSLPTPEAQCLGRHAFELALFPFAAPWWEHGLTRHAQDFVLPPSTVGAGHAPATSSLLEVSPSLVLSAVKRAESGDGLIVRVYNPAPRAAAGRISLARRPTAAYRVRLDETRDTEIDVERNDISLALGPKQVATLEVVFAEAGDLP